MFKKILVAFDDSKHSVKALNVAIDLCKKYDAMLSVAMTVNLPELPDNIEHYRASERFSVHTELKKAASMAEKEGVPVVTHLLRGSPAVTLQRFAEDNDFDLVLVGARGKNAVTRFLMGSVSTHLVTNLLCPVLVVKEKSS